MALTPEQVKQLKEQLRNQVQHLPESKKAQALEQIESLSPEALELMLSQKQNPEKEERSVFRLIVNGKIPSIMVDENKSAIAVMEINPISKGHVIIISKDEKELTPSAAAFTLAKKLSERIISKLRAKSAEIQTETKLGETIINIIPVYDKPLNINSPRKKAEKEELEEIASKIRKKAKPKIEKIKIKKEGKKESSGSQILKLPRKIP